MIFRNRRRLADCSHFPAKRVQYHLCLRDAGLGGRCWYSERLQRHLRHWAVYPILGGLVHLEGKDVKVSDCEGLHVLCFEAVRSKAIELASLGVVMNCLGIHVTAECDF